MLYSSLFLSSLVGIAVAQFDASDLMNVTSAFMMAQIVPNVVPTFAPTDLLVVQFPTVNVTPGDLLAMADVAMEPQFTLEIDPNSDDSAIANSFIIVMVDPDAPTPQNPTVADFLHFVGGDFNPDPVTGLLSNSSPALLEYFSPTPPAGSDPHRYVVLLYNQPDSFDTDASDFANSTTSRSNFNLTTFAQQLGIGDPVAGNYFLVGPDGSASGNGTGTAAAPTAVPTDTSAPILPTDLSTDLGTATAPAVSPAAPTITTSSAKPNFDVSIILLTSIALIGLVCAQA